MKPRRPVGIAKRAKIQQHRHTPPGLAGMNERLANEGISEPMCAVRRVRDDVLGKGFVRFQEVVPPCPVASVNEIGGHHLVSCDLEHLGDGSVTTCRLPDIALEGFDGQKRPCRLWRGWVKFEGSSLRIAKISGRNF